MTILCWCKTKKHQIVPEEIEEVIYEDKPILRKGPGSGKDKRYYVLGQTLAGRYLMMVLQKEGGRLFSMVTAREMEDAERRLYKKHVR